MAKSNWHDAMMREYHMQHPSSPTAPKPEPPKHRPLPSSTMRQYGIAALGREARRRGTTYGKLCSKLTAAEQEEIVREYYEEMMLEWRGGKRRGR